MLRRFVEMAETKASDPHDSSQRRRSAGIVAIGTFLLPLINVAFGSLAFTIPTVTLSVLGAALVASTWKELHE